MSSSIDSIAGLGAVSAAANSAITQQATASADKLGTRDTFLKLLVAQLRNQNPLSPADGIQFVTQLAQFSSLEQNVQMAQDLTSIRETLSQRLPVNNPATTPKP